MTEHLMSSFKNKENILFIKKKEFDIFYMCKEKYPALVVNKIHDFTGKTLSNNKIKRSEIEDPFGPDKSIPKKCSMTLKEYKKYMEYGGSLGHNAPAGHHKTDVATYNETFLFSNICPQEITFNTGLWVVLETWTKRLQDEAGLENITVFTGNIPSKKNMDFGNVSINVPEYMYKLVACKHKDKPNKFYIACFLMKNEPPKEKIHKIYKYLVSLKELTNLTGINFFKMFSHYLGFNPNNFRITSMNKIVRIDVKFNKMLARQMISSLYYGKLIYSKSLIQLEKNWDLAKKSGFGDEYHEIYYKYAKKRLTREMKSTISKIKKDKLGSNSKTNNKSSNISKKTNKKSKKSPRKSASKTSNKKSNKSKKK